MRLQGSALESWRGDAPAGQLGGVSTASSAPVGNDGPSAADGFGWVAGLREGPGEALRGTRDLRQGPMAQAKVLVSLVNEGNDARILDLLEGLGGGPAALGPVLYEVSLHGREFPPRMAALLLEGEPKRARPSRVERLERLLGVQPPEGQSLAERARAMALALVDQSSIQNPAALAYRTAVLRHTYGDIFLGGKRLPRWDAPPGRPLVRYPVGKLYQVALDVLFRSRLTEPLSKALGYRNLDAPEEVQAALTTPLHVDPNGEAPSLGDLTIIGNGFGNFNAGPATVFRAARYTKGPVVLMFNSPDTAFTAARLRPLSEVEGHPVPPELRGKIWGLGEPSPDLLTWRQDSDLSLRQLEVLRRRLPELLDAAPALRGVASFDDLKVTVLAHSQGALAWLATRHRLVQAGFGNLVDRLIAIGGAYGKGSPFADGVDEYDELDELRGLGRYSQDALRWITHGENRVAAADMDPDFVERAVKAYGLDLNLIDLSYFATLDRFPKRGDSWHPATYVLRLLAGLKGEDDGLVPNDSSRHPDASRNVHDRESRGHVSIWRDWRVIDQIVQHPRTKDVSSAAA